MIDILRVTKEQIGLRPKQWVRLKRGLYQDDIAQVDHVDVAKNEVHLKLLPRIEFTRPRGALRVIQDSESLKRKKKKRPAAKPFDPEAIRALGGDVTSDGDFMIFEGNRYRLKGFLYKNFDMNAILKNGVKPTLSELEKFEEAPEGVELELPVSSEDETAGQVFSAGDNVKVCEGELIYKCGQTQLDATRANEKIRSTEFKSWSTALGDAILVLENALLIQPFNPTLLKDCLDDVKFAVSQVENFRPVTNRVATYDFRKVVPLIVKSKLLVDRANRKIPKNKDDTQRLDTTEGGAKKKSQKRKLEPAAEMNAESYVKKSKTAKTLQNSGSTHNRKIKYLEKCIQRLEDERECVLISAARIIALEYRIQKMYGWIAEVFVGEAASKTMLLLNNAGPSKVARFGNHYDIDMEEYEEKILEPLVLERNRNCHFDSIPKKKMKEKKNHLLKR